MVEQQVPEALGRETELGLVDQFLGTVHAGPSALVLHGEPGIGKTTVWNHGVALASSLSFSVLSCRPTQAESDLPYLGLGDLLAVVSDETFARLPHPQRRALDIALLRAEAEGTPLHQRAVAVAVLTVLRETSADSPLLVAIDDAQWLDAPSRRVLRFAMRRLGHAPVGFLVTTRATPYDEDILGLGDIRPSEHVRHVTVAPLAPAIVHRLVRSQVASPIAVHVLRRVTDASGGNPLFALELVRALADSSDAAEPGKPLTIPASLTELVGSRLARLPKATRDSLLVAAALSRPTVELIQRARGRSAEVVAALAGAVDAGVIELRGGAITFVHPLLAGVLYSQASAGELRQLHGRLAAVAQDPEERARHLGLSTVAPDDAVAEAMARGGSSAAIRGAPDVAAALFEKAARLTPPDAVEAAAARLVDAADQYVALREMGRARLLLDEAVSSVEAGTVRARALHRLWRVRGLKEGFEASNPLLLEALVHVGEDVALQVAIERDFTFAQVQVGNPSAGLPHARAAYRVAEQDGRDELLAEALDQLCMVEFASGNAVPAELLERAISFDERAGPTPLAEHPGWSSGRLLLALTLKWTDRFDLARGLLRSLLSALTDRGDEGSLDTVLFQLGELELWAGNWQTVSELCAAAEEMEARTGQAVVERRMDLLRVMLEEVRGNTDAARSRGTKFLELAERGPDPPGLVRCLGSLGRLELSLRHAGDAAEYLLRGLAVESRAGYDPSICRILPNAIEALIEAGRMPEAETHLRSLEAHGTKLDRSWALAAATKCRALFDAANGDLALANSAFENASDLFKKLGEPLEHGRARLALGTVQRRLKKKREARETLDEALGIFEALGARAWSQLTRAEQGRIGGRPSSPHELTPTETRIAQLVAEGMTNREVAAAMFLSEKTIETNLTRIYEKLAVTSRRELARKHRVSSAQA